MLSMKKTALLAAISAFALGSTPDAARAGDGYRHNRAEAHQGGKTKVFHKASYKRTHGADRRAKAVQRVHHRRWQRAPRRWAPPRRYHRKHRHWDGRRHYRHKQKHRKHHGHWKHHGHGGGNELIGTVIGAALGAVIGDGVSKGHGKGAVIVGGAVVGGIIGNRIGRSMDKADHHHASIVLETAPTGHPVDWTNPDNGRRYTMTPVRTYRNDAGEDCRDYTVWGWIDGYEEKLHGTACRTEDGAWRTVS